MPKLYSLDLKNKVIDATESGYTDSSISETFNIARKTIYNWKK
ncbi:MAG: IS630 transposase-related protein, partial [Oligoflexales bacterium]